MSRILVGQLINKYRRLLGQYRVIEHEIEQVTGYWAILNKIDEIEERKSELRRSIKGVELAIRQWDPEFDPSTATPIQPRVKHLPHKAAARAALVVLREADRPLKAREIAHMIAGPLGVDPKDLRAMSRLDSNVRSLCESREGHRRGAVYLHPGKPKRWARFPPPSACDAAKNPSTPAIPGAAPLPA